MRCLDLFTGIGGMGRLLPFTPVMYCEKNPFCRAVLERRMRDGDIQEAPIHDDVFTLDPPNHEILIGGFPCQDISKIGVQRGFQGTNSSLYFQILRIVKIKHPKFIFLENVRNIVTMPNVWKPVLTTLAQEGYDLKWATVGAFHCGMPHKRLRWFMLATYTGKSTTPTLDREKMDLFGDVTDGVYHTRTNPKFKEYRRKTFYVKALPDIPSKGIVTKKTFVRDVWMTPRAFGGARALHNLTKSGMRDLASELRFATCTKHRYFDTNLKWVEQLMGLPANWTNPEARVEDFAGFEEAYPRMMPDKTQKKYRTRWKTLGNMCVSQCAIKAYAFLTDQHNQYEKATCQQTCQQPCENTSRDNTHITTAFRRSVV